MNSCQMPIDPSQCVTLAHGGGGRLTDRLVREIFAPAFGLDRALLNDGAEPGNEGWVITTDAHVVHPLIFPGGDIGCLAAHGTCNDLAMAGAAPAWLAVSWILEEGVSIELVRRVAESLAAGARMSGAKVVAGDTKVVERGKGDGIFLQACGFGKRMCAEAPGPWRLAPGQALVVSGDMARHGAAIMSARGGGLGFAGDITSDCGPLWPLVRALFEAGIEPVAMRDCTRGGLATVLAEWAEGSSVGLVVQEAEIPVLEAVRGACEVLGLDPLYVACEGRFVAAVEAGQAEASVAVLRGIAGGEEARVIGEVSGIYAGRAIASQAYGTQRVLDRLAGEALPRIC